MMINFLVWLFAGALIGWMATLIMRNRSSLLPNIVVGILGLILTGFVITPMLHLGTILQASFNILGLLLSLGVTAILLLIVNLTRTYRNRAVPDEVIKKNWEHVRDKIHTRWSKLSEADIETIDGNHDRFINSLQERYGFALEQAEDQLQGYLKATTRKNRSSFLSSFLYGGVQNGDPSHAQKR